MNQSPLMNQTMKNFVSELLLEINAYFYNDVFNQFQNDNIHGFLFCSHQNEMNSTFKNKKIFLAFKNKFYTDEKKEKNIDSSKTKNTFTTLEVYTLFVV